MSEIEPGEETVTLVIRVADFPKVKEIINEAYEIKKAEPYKLSFPDDPVWVGLKKASDEAYKDLKKYEWSLINQ